LLLGLGQRIGPLQPHQLTAAGRHHLAHVPQAPLEFAQHLFGVAVGPFLHGGGLLAAAGNQRFALLLGLLAELQGIGLHPLRLRLAALLQPQRLLADLLQLQQALLAGLLVLLRELALELDRLLVELLAPLQGLLFQLLAVLAELLLQLGQATLMLLLGLRHLLAGLADQLLALLAGLFPQLTPPGARPPGARPGALISCSRCCWACCRISSACWRAVPMNSSFWPHQGIGLAELGRQGFTHRIHQLDGVLLVHQAPAAEGNAGAIEHDLLELIELIEHGAHLGADGASDITALQGMPD
jgi:hypothetical protein